MWALEGEEHARRVAEWTVQYARLKADGIRVKDLPKKPGKRRKQDVVDEVNAAATSHVEEDVAMDDDGIDDEFDSDDGGA